MKPTKSQFAVSLGIALLACFLPYLFSPGSRDSFIRYSLGLALVWLVLLLVAFIRYRSRSLWFLLGLPFAFYWPFMLLMLAWNCARNLRQCP